MMATAQGDTTMTKMVMDFVNNNDANDEGGNNASSTTSDESNNCNQDDGKDACALAATTSSGSGASRGKGGAKRCNATTSWHERRRGVKDGRVRRLHDKR
jgi:hypothetical protein